MLDGDRPSQRPIHGQRSAAGLYGLHCVDDVSCLQRYHGKDILLMNRFLIEHHPDAIAKSLCDKHIVKMPLEEAQMLCTSLWHHAPEYAEEHGL